MPHCLTPLPFPSSLSPEEEEVLESCMVGVARDSMKRKGDLSLRPEDGVWALRLSSSGIWANTSPEAELSQHCGPGEWASPWIMKGAL